MARAWAGGRSGSSESGKDKFRAEVAAFGIDAKQAERVLARNDTEVTVWRENWIAVQVFFGVYIETLGTMSGIFYTGVRAGEIRQAFEDQRWPGFAWRRFGVPAKVRYLVSEAAAILNDRNNPR